MSIDTLEDLPVIDAALIDTPAPRTDVAVAAAAALDLAKVDLTDVALAQFGPWRQSVADVTKNIATLALDLSIQARIDEAKSLRRRLFDQPRADIRKVSKELKSKLAKVSKAIGAEEDAAVAAYDEAEKPLTAQIDAAQKVIDDEKEAKRQAENVRLSGLREAVDAIMAKWLERCNIEGITAERIAKGGDLFSALPMPAEVADVSVYWDTKVGTTLAEMRKLHGAALAREEAARLEAQRIENERIAAEQARVAAELAAQQRALAEQAAALARQAEAIEAARQRAITPAVAGVKDSLTHEPAATEGKAETPGAGSAEAAPNTAATLPTESALDELEAPPLGDPQGSSAGSAQGVDSRESQAGSPVEARQPITQDAQESGFVTGTPGLYASSEAQAAQALPSGDDGRDARADECASQPDFTVRDIVFSERGSAGATNVSIRLEDFSSFDLRTAPPPPAPASDTAHATDIASRVILLQEPQPSHAAFAVAELVRLRDQISADLFDTRPEWFSSFYAAVEALKSAAANGEIA